MISVVSLGAIVGVLSLNNNINALNNNKIEQEEVSEVLYLYNVNTFFNDTSLSSVLNNE